MTVIKSERTERERVVAEAIHSAEMEGLTVSEAAVSDSAAYVAGQIDSAELVARARARYGLD
ncbi:antitoxin VbhA family protein [Nocardioides hungaricus]